MVLKEKTIETALWFAALKVMSTLEVFGLASLPITDDIYFDNYTIECFFQSEHL